METASARSRQTAGDEIPVIDIFAGPGGLGEGFAAFETRRGTRPFRIRLSIEMDEHAHRTLLLRSFFRQFEPGAAPAAYYEYLRGEGRWQGANVDALLDAFPRQGARAREAAWREELRPAVAEQVDRRIAAVLGPPPRRGPWVLVGGPPCQAYSLAGRARMLGADPEGFYRDRRHWLYEEYLRLLVRHAPPVFIMENVKGLLSARGSTGARILERILEDLRRPPRSTLRYALLPLYGEGHSHGPDASDDARFIVQCERHGIPQARHRIIILGVLESEYGPQARLPRPLAEHGHAVTCAEAIGDLPRLRSGISRRFDSSAEWLEVVRSALRQPWYEIMAGNGQADVARVIRETSDRLSVPRMGRGGRFVPCLRAPSFGTEWFHDPALDGVCSHESRAHRYDDLHRYLFVSAFGRSRKASPTLKDFPAPLLPLHANVSRALGAGLFSDRFRVQLAGAPATTVTAHISKDGHYFIHYDPSQCRSLTVREAARIQTFPDSYFFEGPRTEQYRQVGNAVPPLLAREIAGIVYEGIRRQWK